MIDREVVIVLGKTGQGKSVWTRSYLLNKPRVFIFDPVRDFPADKYFDNAQELAEFVEHVNEGLVEKFRVALSDIEHLDLLGNASFLVGNCFLAIEEAAFCFEMRQRSPQWLRDIIFLGRHRGVSLLMTAQRAVSIPIDLRSQASRAVSFAQTEGRDMDWLRDYFGDRTYEIEELGKLECLDSKLGEVNRYRLAISKNMAQNLPEPMQTPIDFLT